MKHKTSIQVAREVGVHRITAIKWAQNNGVKKWGRDYTWTQRDERRFKTRDKKRGPKFGGGKKG